MNPIDELTEKIRDEPFQIGRTQGGGYAWWCFLCRTGDAADTGNDVLNERAVGIAGLHHILGPDHEAQRILHP